MSAVTAAEGRLFTVSIANVFSFCTPVLQPPLLRVSWHAPYANRVRVRKLAEEKENTEEDRTARWGPTAQLLSAGEGSCPLLHPDASSW